MRKVESTIQKEMISLCRRSQNLRLAFHINNEGAKSVGQAVQDKKLGSLSGIPDLCIPMAGGRVVWVEVKTLEGRLSKNQIDIHEKLTALGHEVHTVYGLALGVDLLLRLEGLPRV